MHVPVLQKEIIRYLDPKPNENFIDATLGEGGHTLAILERNGPKGKVLGIDADPEQIKNLKTELPLAEAKVKMRTKFSSPLKIKNWEKRIVLACGNFADLKEIIRRNKFNSAKGILFDLGMSSWHLEDSGRGFSFQKKEPLDMRYNAEVQSSKFKIQNLTAEKIVNYGSFQELEKILREYGEEQFSRDIAEKIIEARKIRPIETTSQLVAIIKTATPGWYQRGRINPATRTFQALRIAVNDELKNLEKALPQTLEILKKGGRLAIISFHSLEDRIVKTFFRENENDTGDTRAKLRVLTKKPVGASFEEIKINPRSRSAKLRVAIKL